LSIWPGRYFHTTAALLAALNFASVFKNKKRLENKKNVKNVKNVTKILKKRKKRKKTFFYIYALVRWSPISQTALRLLQPFSTAHGVTNRQIYRRRHTSQRISMTIGHIYASDAA